MQPPNANPWTSGYVAEVTYTQAFYRELAPTILNYALLSRGVVQPSTDSFKYCELGCGFGLSTNMLAAAHPGAEFWATDFNPVHISTARRLANSAGLKNVKFFDDSFEDFLLRDLPSFDYISLHGIYSWVSKENRGLLIEFLRRYLKVGSAAYLSYNALPGWASAMPLRRLLIEAGASFGDNLLGRIGKAIDFAEELKSLNAVYFASSPQVPHRLQKIKESNKQYVAHEYFNKDWDPFYHADIVDDMSRAKLTYVCSAHILDHLDGANLTQPQRERLQKLDDPVLRETTRDFFVNQQFRRDVYVKGPESLSVKQQRDLLIKTRFALTAIPLEVPMTLTSPVGTVNLQEDLYRPILAGLADGPCSMEQLLTKPEATGLNFQQVNEALTLLVGAGHVQPCSADAPSQEAAEACSKLNHSIIQMAKDSSDLQFLVSPVTGSGIQVDRLSQLFLAAGHEGVDNPTEFALRTLETRGHALVRNGKSLIDRNEALKEVEGSYTRFATLTAPLLRKIGIL